MRAFAFTMSVFIGLLVYGFSKVPHANNKVQEEYPIYRLQPSDTLPAPFSYVNDFEKLFTPQQQASLDALIAAFEQKTTIQMAVVTIDTTMTTAAAFDNYTLRLLNQWGVGVQGKDNGILIGISKGYRKLRIQNGYGIEKRMSDAETKAIVDTAFVPLFKEGRYFEGTLKGLQAIMGKLE